MPNDRQPPPRPGSKPDIQGAERELDRVLGGAENQRRQDQPKRTATLPHMAALKAPPIFEGAEPPLPGPPPLPLEAAKTVPAAAHQAATQRAPSPIEVRAVRIETQPESRQSAPAPSADQTALAAAIKDRDRLRSELEKALTDSIRPDGTAASLRKAQTRLYLGIAAALVILAAPLAAYLTAAAEAARTRSERAAVQAGNATTAADSAKASANSNDKELTALRAEFRQYRANMREVLRLQGIESAKHSGDPDPNELEPVTPYCPRGKVCNGPQIILQKPP
jgi:hypothetical protein